MKILAVDVGTGTQDILLFDSDKEIENSLKLVMPSPTVLVANRIRAATVKREKRCAVRRDDGRRAVRMGG